jgi:hypothetical protein
MEFLRDNSIFVVLLVVLIIWLGIAVWLFIVERGLGRAEKKLDDLKLHNKE